MVYSFLALLISAILVIPLAGCSSQTAATATGSSCYPKYSAAASLTDALKAIDALYTQTNPNVTLTPNFASSGTLQTQIEHGAPADIFISAAAAQMDDLQKKI